MEITLRLRSPRRLTWCAAFLLCAAAGCSRQFLRERVQDLSQVGMVGFEHPYGAVAAVTAGPLAAGVGGICPPDEDDEKPPPLCGRSVGLGLAPGAVYTYEFVEEHQVWIGGEHRMPRRSLAGPTPVGRRRWYIFNVQWSDRTALVEHEREPRHWPIAGAFDLEAVVGIFPVGLRANFNPAEFLDFLVGWVGVDLLGDDSTEDVQTVPPPPVPPPSPPRYDDRFPAPVGKDRNRWGYIDRTGKVVIETDGFFAYPFSEGIARVRYGYDGPWNFDLIDLQGRSITPHLFSGAGDFREGLAPVARLAPFVHRGQYYITPDGRQAFEREFSQAEEFREGLAAVQSLASERWGFINHQGQYVIGPTLEGTPGLFSGGRAVMRVGRKSGYIDRTGRMVIEPQYHRAGDFAEGLALVAKDGRYDAIDTMGATVFSLPPEVTETGEFSEGLAAVKVADRWGYIDRSGRRVIDARFERAGAFSEGRADVQVAGRFGYIDRTGALIIEARYSSAEPFRNGLAFVTEHFAPLRRGQRATVRYIDRDGKVVWTGQR